MDKVSGEEMFTMSVRLGGSLNGQNVARFIKFKK